MASIYYTSSVLLEEEGFQIWTSQNYSIHRQWTQDVPSASDFIYTIWPKHTKKYTKIVINGYQGLCVWE
jgi:hypothetical protein